MSESKSKVELSEIIKQYAKIIITETKGEKKLSKIGDLMDFQNFERHKEISGQFSNFNEKNFKLESVLKVWGSGENENLGELFKKEPKYDRLINAVSNKIRLSVCLKEKNEISIKNIANKIFSTLDKLKNEINTDLFQNKIIKGTIEIYTKDLLKNEIQSFLKELFYWANFEDDKYPLWNGCTKNAISYIKEIETNFNGKKELEILSNLKIDLQKALSENNGDEKNNYKGYPYYYLLDKLMNVMDKITSSDISNNDDDDDDDKSNEENNYLDLYQKIWKYLQQSKTARSKKNKIDGHLKKLLLKKEGKNIILYGPPGTSKTYGIEETIKEILRDEIDDMSNVEEEYNKRTRLVQFHPSYDYEDFIEGYKVKATKDKTAIFFEKQAGTFKSFVDKVLNDENSKNLTYYFIIDEINRADLSKVLGELIYCLEKRGQAIALKLTDWDEKFFIPENIHIIGTMNTVDKSVDTFDIALRRRFIWLHRTYDKAILETMLIDIDKVERDKFIDFANNLNKKIEGDSRLGSNYVIGHAIFQKAIDGNKLKREEFETYHLKPLLKEYLRYSIENETELDKEVTDFISNAKK